MKEYSKRIEKLRIEISEIEKNIETALSKNKKHLVRRLSLIKESKEKKIASWLDL